MTVITQRGPGTDLYFGREETALEQDGFMTTVSRRWLEYDWATLAVLFIGIGVLELLVFSM